MRSIAVVGSINMDIAMVIPRMPLRGETIKCQQSQISPGGKGANQAVAVARMGSAVCMIGKLGNDPFAASLLANLRTCGIDTQGVLNTSIADSGKAFILISEGDNSIILDPGSNDQLTPEDVERISGRLVECAGVLVQHEIPMSVVNKTIEICKGKTPIFLNPAPAARLEKSILGGIDYFICNEIECEFYTGIRPVEAAEIYQALARLESLGILHPVITLGSKGVAYLKGQAGVIKSAYHVNVLDSTAAGDTFVGAFAAMICTGADIDMAADMAQAAAALTCTRVGAQNAIPDLDAVQRFFKQEKLST